MKSIIDGKRYNTETAEEIADYSNRLSNDDFNKFSETLYRTKNGNWFLHGVGGPMTKYSESNGSTTWGSSRITPLSETEVIEWLEKHDEVDILETYFPDHIEDA